MPIKELTDKYGKTNCTQAINAAIRAEIPGGGTLLDTTGLLFRFIRSNPELKERLSFLSAALADARQEMADHIAEKYELQTAKGKNNAETTGTREAEESLGQDAEERG